MRYFEVVTIGSALKDIMFYSDELSVLKSKSVKKPRLLAVEYGTKIPIDEVYVNYGGGAMNVAVGLKNFGVKVAPLAMLGKDQVGKEIYSYLKQNKIDTSLLQVDKKQKTGFSIIISSKKDREHTIFTHKGASSFLKLPNLRSFRTKWFYVTALSNSDWAVEFEKVVRQTKKDVKIAWNPGTVQLKDSKKVINFLSSVEVLILNKDEAIGLVSDANPNIEKEKLTNSKDLLRALKELGPKKVVVTQDSRGAMGIDDLGKFHYMAAQGVQKRVKDTVGAGDAFSSGFIAGLVKWNDFSRAMKLGIRNSAHVLYLIGAQNGLLKINL